MLGTVVIGMIWFGDPAVTMRILLIFGLVACIVGLRLTVAWASHRVIVREKI